MIYPSHFGFPLCCALARNAHVLHVHSACSLQARLAEIPNCSGLFVPYTEILFAMNIEHSYE